MKIKVSKKKIITFVITFVLIICLVSCSVMTIKAAPLPNSPVTSGKLIDMILTRSGKVVNSDMRDSVVTQTRNVLNDTATSYWQWLKDNGLNNTTENFRAYLESDAYASLPFRLAKFPLELASFIEWLINGDTLLDMIGTDVEDVLSETDITGNVSVPSESVNIINQVFDDVSGDYFPGYRYVDVLPVDSLQSTYFGDQQSYLNVKEYIKSSDYPTLILQDYGNKTHNTWFIHDNSQELVIKEYKHDWNQEYFSVEVYNTSWQLYNVAVELEYNCEQVRLVDNTTFNELSAEYDYTKFTKDNTVWGYFPTTSKWSRIYLFGKTSGTYRVYRTIEDYQNYIEGKTPYYLTNKQYSDSVDNSFNVSGEYLQNNGGNFSYEQIREQINNSNVTNDSSVSNIVNDYSQTIINNYNYSSGGNGGDNNGNNGGNNDNDDNSGNGILNILGAIGEVINFILNVIAEIISILTSFLTTIFDMLKNLGGIFSSFSQLLGELFVFIPQQLIDLLTASLSAVVLIALWKKISK